MSTVRKFALLVPGAEQAPVPYPPETRSKGWIFELDIERAHNSDTWMVCPPEIRPWLVMMWMESWLCTPCGSYPNDYEIIAARIGMPINLFRAHSEVLLRGWALHSDGRLYHPVVTERVLDMIGKRQAEVDRKARWRAQQLLNKGSAPQSNQPHSKPVPRDNGGTPVGETTPPPPPPPPELQKPKPKARSRPASAPEPQVDLPPWLNANDWQAFLAHRINIRKPMNAEAQRRAVIRLGRFRREGHDPNKVLDLSIVNGWQGLFTDNETKAGQDLGALIAELTAKGK